MDNHALEIIGLSKAYRNFQLVDASLSIETGSIVGLIGHNGAGKTTLIKSVLGLVKKDAGEILMPCSAGFDPGRDLREFCGYVPESLVFYEWMKVGRLVKFISRFYKTWDDQLCKSLLIKYGLDEAKEIRHLSNGMRAKLALIIALAHRPPIILLDEPTTGLDPMMKHIFLQELRKAIRTGATHAVLISSHILGEIEQIADRVAVMKNGRITFDETVDGFLQKWSKVTFVNPPDAPLTLPYQYAINETSYDQQMIIVREDDVRELMNLLIYQGATDISVTPPNLNEVFVQVA